MTYHARVCSRTVVVLEQFPNLCFQRDTLVPGPCHFNHHQRAHLLLAPCASAIHNPSPLGVAPLGNFITSPFGVKHKENFEGFVKDARLHRNATAILIRKYTDGDTLKDYINRYKICIDTLKKKGSRTI